MRRTRRRRKGGTLTNPAGFVPIEPPIEPTSEELARLSCRQKVFKECRASGKMDFYCKKKGMDKCEKYIQGGKRRRRRRTKRRTKRRKSKRRRKSRRRSRRRSR